MSVTGFIIAIALLVLFGLSLDWLFGDGPNFPDDGDGAGYA